MHASVGVSENRAITHTHARSCGGGQACQEKDQTGIPHGRTQHIRARRDTERYRQERGDGKRVGRTAHDKGRGGLRCENRRRERGREGETTDETETWRWRVGREACPARCAHSPTQTRSLTRKQRCRSEPREKERRGGRLRGEGEMKQKCLLLFSLISGSSRFLSSSSPFPFVDAALNKSAVIGLGVVMMGKGLPYPHACAAKSSPRHSWRRGTG